MLAALAAYATLIVGSYISETPAALACDGWPLCNGTVAPRGGTDVGWHWMHRMVAGVLGLFILAMTWAAFDERRGRRTIALAGAAGVLYITQAIVGAANLWTELADGVVVAHLSLAALLWCLLVAATALSFYEPAHRRVSAAARHEEEGKVREWAR
jgi:heme A synthase